MSIDDPQRLEAVERPGSGRRRIGAAVLLVGLVVNPLVFRRSAARSSSPADSLGSRDHDRAPARSSRTSTTSDRYPAAVSSRRRRSGSAVSSPPVAVPTAGFALLPSLTGQRRRRRRPRADRARSRKAVRRRDLPRGPAGRRGLATRRVHPQQRARRRTCRASRSCRAAARTSAVRRSRTGRSSIAQHRDRAHAERRGRARPDQPAAASAARVTAASSTTRATAPRARRRALSTGTSSRFATATCGSAPLQRQPRRRNRSGGADPQLRAPRTPASPSPGPSHGSTRSPRVMTSTNTKGALTMKRFSPRLFALGLVLGALGAAAVLAAGASPAGCRAHASARSPASR